MDSFKVSNFRIFGEEGTEVSFTPVTILTGSNSSGKSSFVKALVAFGDYISSLIEDEKNNNIFNPSAHKLNLVRTDLNLKGFSNIINRNSGENKIITFSYDCSPDWALGSSYNVCYSFSQSNISDLDQGELLSIEVSNNGEKILSYNCENGRMNLNVGGVVLNDFISFYGNVVLKEYLKDSILHDEYVDIINNSSSDRSHKHFPIHSDLEVNELGESLIYRRYIYEDTNDYHDEGTNHDALWMGLNKLMSEGTLFYFPILERFKIMSKAESISFLRSFIPCKNIMTDDIEWIKREIGDPTEYANRAIETIANLYESDTTESFFDYYLKLEHYLLAHYDKASNYSYCHVPSREDQNFEDWILKHIFYIDVGLSKLITPLTNKNIVNPAAKFFWAYYALFNIQYSTDKSSKNNFENAPLFNSIIQKNGYWYFHLLYLAFEKYIHHLFYDLLLPLDIAKITYNSESFSRVQRLFLYEDNSLIVRTINKYKQCSEKIIHLCERLPKRGTVSFYGSRCRVEDLKYEPGTFLKRWGGKDGLDILESFQINDIEGLGFTVYLNRENLADLGHGVTQAFFMLLQIEVCIIEERIISLEDSLRGQDVEPRINNRIFAIEEPEVSLHPCFQSRLADIFADAIRLVPNLMFIIETHSEYLVRRTQAIVAGFDTEEQFKNNPFSVHYFLNDGSAYEMVYQESGRFANSFGPGFFDEAGRSSIEILKKEKMLQK